MIHQQFGILKTKEDGRQKVLIEKIISRMVLKVKQSKHQVKLEQKKAKLATAHSKKIGGIEGIKNGSEQIERSTCQMRGQQRAS